MPEGLKYDGGKPRAALVLGGFANALLEVAKVGTFGAEKYAPNNWKLVDRERYEDALFRHLLQWQSGELVDPETGLLHLAHAAWNALAILQLIYYKCNIPKAVEDKEPTQLKLPLELEGGYDDKGTMYMFGKSCEDE